MHPLRLRDFLGQYEIVRAIGSGGMGVVYEARHRALGRLVAIKVLHASDPSLPGASIASARFLREGRAAAQVRHPHVVDVFDIGVEDGVPFLVMELVRGETLAEKIARDGPLPLTTIAEILLPIASAVAELHAAGIVHRDLKPANILLARGRAGEIVPKVADFGVSRLEDGSDPITEGNAVVGTYAYMAPEHARSTNAATELSDLYALGVIAYECATGKRPFDAPAPLDLVDAIVHAELVPPSALDPSLPPAFDAFVLRAMSRDPAERFPSAEELGEALLGFAEPRVAQQWVAELVPPRSRDASTSIRSVTSTPTPPRPRRAAFVMVVAAAAASLVTLLAVRMTLERGITTGPEHLAAARAPVVEIERGTVTVPPVASSPAAPSAPSALASAAASETAPARPPPRRAPPHPTPSVRRTAQPPLDNGAPILDPE